MKLFLLLAFLLPAVAQAKLIFQYGLNYASENDQSDSSEYNKTRTFHDVFLGGSINGRKTLFFGWNINSWSSSLEKDDVEDTYSLTEMGPKITWFTSDNYNLYMTAEWNPYARGKRDKNSVNKEISGNSMGIGIGYRFKINRFVGLGAGLHYHVLNIKEEKEDTTEENISDKVTNIMPMLELVILTR